MVVRKPGLGKRGNIEENAKVFHVVQRTTLKLPLFENKEIYEYWSFHLKASCSEEGVTLLCAIMMTNHYHVLLYAENRRAIQRVFQRVNSGLSKFVFTKVIKDSKYQDLFSKTNPYRLFSSTERMFPVEGYIPLLIDTKYLFDNPRHHSCPATGLRYENSTFMELYKGDLDKKYLKVFFDLYGGYYPGQIIRLISKPLQEFNKLLEDISMNLSVNTENQLFKIDPKKPWKDERDVVWESCQAYDI